MIKNINSIDQVVRIVAGAVLIAWYLSPANPLGWIGLVLIATAS